MAALEDFRSTLSAFGERANRVKDHLHNEEATKLHLILPFIAAFGYDTSDPAEVAAEHSSDFSEKYKNRVDYAILRNGSAIIAIECKSVGNGKKDDRGQLKSYFNASKTVKLGILTDGLLYEFFVDSQEPNMMDDEPFLAIDFSTVPKVPISDTLIEGLHSLTKEQFDPFTVSENARRNITHRSFFNYLRNQFADPSIEFTRFLLKENDIKHVRDKAVEGYRAIAKAAFNDVFTAQVLKRLDISEPLTKAPVRVETNAEQAISSPEPTSLEKIIQTTAAELAAFESIRLRLAFLAKGNPVLYDAISGVGYRDYQGKMVVFYLQERKGRLIDIIEGKDGTIRYVLSDGGDVSPFTDLSAVDDRLAAIFERRVTEIER